MKKFKLAFISMILSILVCTTNISVVFAFNDNDVIGPTNDEEVTTINDALIFNKIDKYILVNSNGITMDDEEVILQLEDVDCTSLQTEAESMGVVFTEDLTSEGLCEIISENISMINTEIRNGNLTVLENGALIETNDDNFYVQGGSTYSQKFWWGIRHYKSTSKASLWAGKLNQCAINFTAVGAFSALFQCWPQTGICAASAWYMASLANKVNAVNGSTTRGIRADIRWWFTYSVRKQ